MTQHSINRKLRRKARKLYTREQWAVRHAQAKLGYRPSRVLAYIAIGYLVAFVSAIELVSWWLKW